MAIIVLSHQLGAGGPEIGLALSQRLGYRYVDQELLQDAGRRYGLAEEKLSHLDDSKPSFFERFDTETRHHITVLQTTLLELAELDNAVLMRGGGQWLLRGVPHVLRVRLIAPFEHRVKQWIKRQAETTRETYNQRAAASLVRSDDNEKAGRMRYLYEVELSDPMLYEMTVNTEMLRCDAVVQMIEGLTRRPEMATTEAGRQTIASRALASRDASLPDHRRGAERCRHLGGHDRARAGRGRGPDGARCPRCPYPAGRDPADSALRGLAAFGGGLTRGRRQGADRSAR
jgi:cytidylate kinase